MISTYFNGRLGNQIFQYVAIRNLSKRLNCNFWIPKNAEESSYYSDISKKLSIYLEETCLGNPHHWIGDKIFDIDFGYNDGLIDNIVGEVDLIDINIDNLLLYGFYQSDIYYESREDVKNWLNIKDSLIESSSNIIKKYPIDEYCYIHFRGGDYKEIEKYFLPKTYYIDCIEHMLKININMKFVVITDDPEEASIFFSEYDILKNSVEIDFFLLLNSNYTIIPNSSFSWWACWLNDYKILTIAPDKWFNYNDGSSFSPKDIKTDRFKYLEKRYK